MSDAVDHDRETLAASHRIASYEGLTEGTWNHFSLMIDDQRMLITPADVHWADLKPADLVEADGDWEAARARGELFFIGYRIHYPIHEARLDAKAVLHAHPPHATALALLEDPSLITMSQNAAMFHGRVAINDGPDEFGDPDAQGERLAASIGEKDILIMRGHGVVVVAPTVEQAHTDLYLLELACRTQLLALSTGQKLRRFTEDEVTQLGGHRVGETEASRHFQAMLRHVDRVAPPPREGSASSLSADGLAGVA